MDDSQTAIKNFFAKLGLEPEIARLYAALHQQGAQTISELARSSGVERTHIYRLLDTLQKLNLIEIDSEYKHGLLHAAPLSNLQILIAKKEQDLQALHDDLPLLERALVQTNTRAPGTSVQFYRGAEGVKQMLWNETKADSEVLGILHQNIQLKTKSKFFERWTERCNEREIRFRGIVSDTFQSNQTAWYNGIVKERLTYWEQHYVSPEIFRIDHNTVVYDDVVGHFNWQDNEIFGIEIHNPQIADSQRQMFEILWQNTVPNLQPV